MIYDVNGNVLNSLYDADGNSFYSAYDINGLQVFPDEDVFTVMTYNYQWCTKINGQLSMQQSIIAEYAPDIIGIQEASTKTGGTAFPALVAQFLGDYPTRIISTVESNKNGLASKFPVSDYQNIRYSQNDDEDWGYQKCIITTPRGNTIAWYNTHLTWRHDQETYLRKYSQAAELFEDAEAERLVHPYVIITGDWNMYDLAFDADDYVGIGKQFADAGYTLCNWNQEVGFVKTYTGKTEAESFDEFTYSCDNIIVTPNIDVTEVIFDTIKLDYLNGDPIDHVAVVAKLRIN